ncbi:hypothetical protein HDU82_006801 [Entophlyctis luteolus]|nr:hypothetical protein HDU82_006801 [Entophlyctis luteolus]
MPAFAVSLAAAATVRDIDYGVGMVAFAAVIFMLHTDSFALPPSLRLLLASPRDWVRAMVYLDALAFCVFYLSDTGFSFLPLAQYVILFDGRSLFSARATNLTAILAQSQSNGAQQSCFLYFILHAAADSLWAFKDAFKYGFVVYRAITITGSKRRWPVYFTAICSFILQQIFVIAKYQFLFTLSASQMHDSRLCDSEGLHAASSAGSLSSTYRPLVILYAFWSIVDISMAALIVAKMTLTQRRVLSANFAVETYARYKRSEEVRLLLVCVGMCSVTGLAIARGIGSESPQDDSFVVDINGTLVSTEPFQINRTVFVMMQLLLVLSSANGRRWVGNPASRRAGRSKPAAGRRQGQGGARSGTAGGVGDGEYRRMQER